jgi:hypothetical protein
MSKRTQGWALVRLRCDGMGWVVQVQVQARNGSAETRLRNVGGLTIREAAPP